MKPLKHKAALFLLVLLLQLFSMSLAHGAPGDFLYKLGTQRLFDYPEAIAVDGSGNIYVGDRQNRIQVFNSAGTFLRKWGSEGSGDGQFLNPSGIAIDGSGNVYVADSGNSRIQVFDSSGNFLRKW